jgi:endonuclease/exonuclease/phosphatase family metal-dependent hydrolase
MFHGKISPEVAQGLKVLRERIGRAKIPPSILDETLNIATWNIREFGKMHKRKRRSEAAIHYIAEVLYQFDLIAIVELRDDLTDLNRVMKILGPYWRAVFSDFNTDPAGNRERIAYLYDKRAVVFTGLAAEANPPRQKDQASGEYKSEISWWRSPFMASFSAGNFDFILLTAHIRWGDSEASRLPELKLLAEWVDNRRQEKYVEDKDIIVMGDFNIPQIDDELYRAITSKGLEIPNALRGKVHGSNLARDKRYDQILHYRRYTKTLKDVGGVLDFYCNDWRALFPEEHYPNMDKTGFTFEMSDHLPLWVQLDTWIEDEQLEQIPHRHD